MFSKFLKNTPTFFNQNSHSFEISKSEKEKIEKKRKKKRLVVGY
jgi:hypothetical protein